MTALTNSQYITPENYLEWEPQQDIKHEYLDGEVYGMTGGTLPHNDIALNLASFLKTYLKGKGCKTNISDGKVKVSEYVYFYPDVVVSCDERDKKATQYLEYPCLVVEVLSPTTERYDRGKKFQRYRQLTSLKEYILISSEQKLVEIFRLNEQGFWELHTHSENDILELTSLNLNLPLELIYEDVILEPETDATGS